VEQPQLLLFAQHPSPLVGCHLSNQRGEIDRRSFQRGDIDRWGFQRGGIDRRGFQRAT